MESPIAELGDRLALLMGHGGATVLDYLVQRFPSAASGPAKIWRHLSAKLPESVGLAAGFVPVDADASDPDWEIAKAANLNALAHDLLDAAQTFSRDGSCVGLWLPLTDPVQATIARPH
jgi:hypothetical protein